MEQTFFVLKTDGKYYPMAFITPNDEGGKIRKENYEKKELGEGDEIVIVSLQETTNTSQEGGN